MAIIKSDILPADIYNTLPYINDVTQIPHDNAADIADLKQLLVKYQLPENVRIKLVHIHFKLGKGEVFAARDVHIPEHGNVNIMQAIPASQHDSLYGYHFYVDEDGNLSAYEYMEAPGPDISEQRAFLDEFCQMIKDRGLQHKLGLSIRHAKEDESTYELEYPAKRACIDVPWSVPLPYNEGSFETMTEFLRDLPVDGATKSHIHHKHCGHTDRKRDDNGDGLSDGESATDGDVSDYEGKDGLFVTDGVSREIELGGSKLEKSSGLFEIVSWIADEV
jgi:hypothetical protein